MKAFQIVFETSKGNFPASCLGMKAGCTDLRQARLQELKDDRCEVSARAIYGCDHRWRRPATKDRWNRWQERAFGRSRRSRGWRSHCAAAWQQERPEAGWQGSRLWWRGRCWRARLSRLAELPGGAEGEYRGGCDGAPAAAAGQSLPVGEYSCRCRTPL